ncbi:hypothetical protein EZJ19_02185 [Parasulfuritortus cantonensis]|uniref:Uncharacterized protein n=1 Tax=Parasulfuritortus cantonensis TaxID=2528202 RepID=A0A4R1BM85_9PROT|nr:hypothetical protein [Parasulfuritortus cantonensis]TCJ18543.1 hypothetical protein EZJ19_02185 [Parasulfuritortus cantonensis]
MDTECFGRHGANIIKWLDDAKRGVFQSDLADIRAALGQFADSASACAGHCPRAADLTRIESMWNQFLSLYRDDDDDAGRPDGASAASRLEAVLRAMLLAMHDMAKGCHTCRRPAPDQPAGGSL